jgi:DNA-binding NarL/FixJ family response regulator
LTVVGEAEDGKSAVDLALKLAPDIVVMDINMPQMNGVEATRQIVSGRTNPDGPKVIALSAYSERRFVTEMFSAGAVGYILKNCAFSDLIQAVRVVMASKSFVSSSVEATALGNLAGTAPALGNTSASEVNLSPREREILCLVAEGRSMKGIARQLQISIKTVETYRRNFIEKLGLDNVAELTKYAIREGITTVDA